MYALPGCVLHPSLACGLAEHRVFSSWNQRVRTVLRNVSGIKNEVHFSPSHKAAARSVPSSQVRLEEESMCTQANGSPITETPQTAVASQRSPGRSVTRLGVGCPPGAILRPYWRWSEPNARSMSKSHDRTAKTTLQPSQEVHARKRVIVSFRKEVRNPCLLSLEALGPSLLP